MESTLVPDDSSCQGANEAEKEHQEALALVNHKFSWSFHFYDSFNIIVFFIWKKKTLQDTLFEIENNLLQKSRLRHKIHTAIQNRPEESHFSKLDSSIKKNTAFVRKLKNFTEAQKEGILKDINTLNLTKYISEVANAIVEAKLKMTDISSIIQVCVVLHEKYTDFSPQLLEAWQKVLSLKKDEKAIKTWHS